MTRAEHVVLLITSVYNRLQEQCHHEIQWEYAKESSVW